MEDTKMNCPMCGNDEFESGRVQGSAELRFKRDDAGFLAKVAAATVLGGKATSAKRCLNCGFVAIFSK